MVKEEAKENNLPEEKTDNEVKEDQPEVAKKEYQPEAAKKEYQPEAAKKEDQLETEKKEDQPETAKKEDQPETEQKENTEKKEESASRKVERVDEKPENEIIERVIKINRVAKVVKGGKNFSFSAMVVIGNGKGEVGIGFGKSNEVVEAIKKGSTQAKNEFVKINLIGDTIPHEVIGKFKASEVILKPAGPGTGVIAGGPVRAMCDAVGIKNILTKSMGSRNSINVVKATLNGFGQLRLKRRG